MRIHTAICFVILVFGVDAMTDEEATHFRSSGKYGGKVTVTDKGHAHTLHSDGIPDHPIVRVNPNDPVSKDDIYTVPKVPHVTDKPGCLAMGAIGMTITGTLIYDPLDRDGENAVEGSGRERFDQYGGHTDERGNYHYHKIPGTFMYDGETDKLLGVAFDGFPIYGPMASDLGRDVKNSDLDKCHGRYVHGKYRYHFNHEFPYVLGCYRGSHVTKSHTIFGQCQETSEFDATWGYLCACPRHNPPQGGHAPQQQMHHNGTHAGMHHAPQQQIHHNGTHAGMHQHAHNGTHQPLHHRPLVDNVFGRR